MPQWMPIAASVLFDLAMASLMGVRLLGLFRRPMPQSGDGRRRLLRVTFSVAALLVSSLVLLVFAGRLFLALGPQVGAFAAGIFLAHTILCPILFLGVIRLWQEYALAPRPRRRRIALLQELQQTREPVSEPGKGAIEPVPIDDILVSMTAVEVIPKGNVSTHHQANAAASRTP